MSRKFEYRNPRRRPPHSPLTAHSMFVHTGLPCSGFDCLCHAPGFGVFCGKLGAGHPGFVTDRRFSQEEEWNLTLVNSRHPCPKTTLPNFLRLTAMESSSTAGHPALCKPCWTRCVKRACPRWYAPATAPGNCSRLFLTTGWNAVWTRELPRRTPWKRPPLCGPARHQRARTGVGRGYCVRKLPAFGGRTGKYRGTAVADGTLHGIRVYPPLSERQD